VIASTGETLNALGLAGWVIGAVMLVVWLVLR
jgi:hypothetical protein